MKREEMSPDDRAWSEVNKKTLESGFARKHLPGLVKLDDRDAVIKYAFRKVCELDDWLDKVGTEYTEKQKIDFLSAVVHYFIKDQLETWEEKRSALYQKILDELSKWIDKHQIENILTEEQLQELYGVFIRMDRHPDLGEWREEHKLETILNKKQWDGLHDLFERCLYISTGQGE